MKISFNQGPAGEFEALPMGDYNFMIDSVEEKPAKSADKFPQLMIKMSVVDGPSAGKRSTAFFSLSPKATFRLRELFEKTGCTSIVSRGKTDDGIDQFDADADELIGKYVTFMVRVEDYEGKTNNKFDKPRPFGAQQVATPGAGAATSAQAGAGAKPPAAGGYPGRGAAPPTK